MRALGIDYGAKRVGLALSDETRTIATPLAVLQNDAQLLEHIGSQIHEHSVEEIILGASHNYRGEANPIMKDIGVFREALGRETGLSVHFEPEMLTSEQARRHETKRELRDASAAALILQSYLDRNHT